jgi:glycosyltransferase involved in cell wall biosynthesis
VFVQAWAQRTPLICSKSQGPSQYVTDGKDGLMFDIDNVDQLVEKINMLINDAALGKKLSDAGYQTFLSGFTREKIVADYTSYYSDIIAREGLDT